MQGFFGRGWVGVGNILAKLAFLLNPFLPLTKSIPPSPSQNLSLPPSHKIWKETLLSYYNILLAINTVYAQCHSVVVSWLLLYPGIAVNTCDSSQVSHGQQACNVHITKRCNLYLASPQHAKGIITHIPDSLFEFSTKNIFYEDSNKKQKKENGIRGQCKQQIRPPG